MAVNRDFKQNYFMGGGELYALLPGESNYKFLAQTEDISLNFKIDKVEHQTTEDATLTTDLELTKAVSADITIKTADLNKEILALAFSGEYVEETQAGATGQEKDVSNAEAGAVYEVGAYNITNVSVEYTDANNNTITGQENVDYSVNYQFGLVEIAKDGILVGQNIKIKYDIQEQKVAKFTSLNNTSKELALRVISKPQHGKPAKTDIYRVILTLDGDFNLKSPEDIQKITLKGKVLKDATKEEGKQFLYREVLV